MSNNKIALIIGATAGIGKETALGIAKTGATTVLVGRDKTKGEAVVNEIKEKTNNENVGLLVADLFSIAEIRKLADEFKNKYDRLDILVNNAGAIFDRRRKTVDGFERTFALNHLSYFLLTNLLLDLIKQSAPSRIVSVSSIAHQFANKVDFDDLQYKHKKFSAMEAYAQSKLMNVLFTYELARRLQGSSVTANCLHPGGVASNFADNTGGLLKIVAWLYKNTFAISPAKGAETSIYLATSPEVEGVTGKYFDNKREKKSSEASYDVGMQKRLWETSKMLIGQEFQV
jgi:NAD(P)-dependent dehydrogenase (short-subunit alcohol dehydrogenase family)